MLLELQLQSMAHAASFPEHLEHIAVALHVVVSRPALRSITISHTAGSGAVPDSLLTALLSLLDLSRVQRLRGCEGAALLWTLPGTPAHLCHSLRVLALSSCGLTSLPPVVGELCTLEELRVNSNRLTALPRELGRLTSLRVLAANSNALTALPGAADCACMQCHSNQRRVCAPLSAERRPRPPLLLHLACCVQHKQDLSSVWETCRAAVLLLLLCCCR